MSHEGKLRVALYTVKDVEHGCALSYNYHCITDNITECNDSKCLCSAESCQALYLSVAVDHFDAIMKSTHMTLDRFAMLARACEYYAVKSCVLPAEDAAVLASVGFGEKLFRDSPLWLKFYCAKVIKFIKHERKALPHYLRSKFPKFYMTDDVSKIEADGVYGLRLQNLAITVDRVLSFLRKHPNHLVPPLYPHTDAEVAQKLVFGNSSIWKKLIDFVNAHERTFKKTGLQGTTFENIFKRFEETPSIEAARDVLRCTAEALRIVSSTYDVVAATLQNLADTKTFFHLARYDCVKAEALQISVEDVETGTNVQLPDPANMFVNERELSPYFVMEQLMFWDHQPQRKSDVLCFQGAVELPCPTNIMRCCMTVGGLPHEELQRIQQLLAGRLIHTRQAHIRSLKFAANFGDAFFGSTALDLTIRQLDYPHQEQQHTSPCNGKKRARSLPGVPYPQLAPRHALGNSA